MSYRTNRSAGRPGHPTQFAGSEPKPEPQDISLAADRDARFDSAIAEMRARADIVHWRLYNSPDNGLVVICVQDFDYPDYERTRFVNATRYESEAAADMELQQMLRTGILVRPPADGSVEWRLYDDPVVGLLEVPVSRARYYSYEPGRFLSPNTYESRGDAQEGIAQIWREIGR